jgi:hypothetical protein
MISKRLLRFALGPSFLDPLEEEDSPVAQAHESNKARAERIVDAEASILNFIIPSHIRDGLSSDEKDSEYVEPITLITAGFHMIHSVCHWPVSRIRTKIQTFYVTGYSSTLCHDLLISKWTLSRNPYSGMALSLGVDAIHEVVSQIGISIIEPVVSSEWLSLLVELGLVTASWLLTYPLLEKSLSQTLGLEGPSLREMFSWRYFIANKSLLACIFLWHLCEDLARKNVAAVLAYYVGYDREEYAPRLISRFFYELASNTLGEIFCIPISTTVFQMLARKYGAGPLVGCNWTALLQAVAAEWFTTWSLIELHQFCMKLAVLGYVK